MTNVWLNRWFSVAYHYTNLIRNNEDGMKFTMYGTHPDPRHMSLQACDHAEVEPALPDADYVEFCLEFCQRNSIDVFIPRLKMLPIAAQVQRFESIGTQVIVCQDVPLLKKLMDKHEFYESVLETGIMEMPDYYVVNTVEQFQSAYAKLVEKGHKVCLKPTNSEGGMGFRVIDNNRDRLQDLFGAINRYVSYEEVVRLLSSVERFDDMMVMELLEGYEYSIDSLANSNGELLAAVPRRKAGGRLRLLDPVPELLAIAQRVAETYRIPYNFNIQVKYNHGVPKLLEINPRMSGGLHVSCLSGVNFPYLAVKSALGMDVPVQTPHYNILASHIEQPMLMKEMTNP
ncbi:ATP-grasp domain-containing protein [Tumebacillus permanentifrigoris]|uniref:ATP-grasp domain-containing protein n=1 Tax=Tumebacillus permanentifrigoris TaxID=378543 RepID=A0A316DV82_9BACL|nr:ATP-grasp domain-containing protein [Tumebacillus permanentifrigoris]PWK13102.1 ATP-grasp domain-containing protein [Tumebacillus permanentifrigoris]